MIDYHAIKDTLARLISTNNDELIMAEFTGFLAGIALAVKEPKLSRTIDHNLRTQWEDTHKSTAPVDASMAYGPGRMAEQLIQEFKPKAGNTN